MKCGSTFGATLAHFANSSLPAAAHMPSCGFMDGSPEIVEEDQCPGGDQGPYEFFVNKYPTDTWFKDVFWYFGPKCVDPGNHRWISNYDFQKWQGSFVGMFRDPLSRMVSAFNHFAGSDFNSSEMPSFYKHTQGTITKLLSGRLGHVPLFCSFSYANNCSSTSDNRSEDCEKCLEPAAADLPVALDRLKGFAFIGLLEHFAMSVCLFHAMFGGTCHPVEFANMREGVENNDKESLYKQLEGLEDPQDTAVYDAASKIFWENVDMFNISNHTCRKLCPGVDAFNHSQSTTAFNHSQSRDE